MLPAFILGVIVTVLLTLLFWALLRYGFQRGLKAGEAAGRLQAERFYLNRALQATRPERDTALAAAASEVDPPEPEPSDPPAGGTP